MIKMVKAKDLTLGMVISTDGLTITCLRYSEDLRHSETIIVEGQTHATWKNRSFKKEDELPIYYDDSNGGED